MNKPLIVNVGASNKHTLKIACQRVARNLNAQKINTVIVDTNSSDDVERFEDDLMLKKYKGVDVVLMTCHAYTQIAINGRYSDSVTKWRDGSIRPHLSVLINIIDRNQASLKDNYFRFFGVHCGSETWHALNARQPYGDLYAAGELREIVKQALKNKAA